MRKAPLRLLNTGLADGGPLTDNLGVVEDGALADLLLVEGDPARDTAQMDDPAKTFVVSMKDGRI